MNKMMMVILIIITSVLLCGCANSEQIELTKELSETEIVSTDQRFIHSTKMGESFVIYDIQATVIKADTNLTYIGNNRNEQLMGVYIFIDYVLSETLESELFWMIDVKENRYNPITADGLDTLGSYRHHHKVQMGYIRFSLPEKYSNFLLAYVKEDVINYIHIVIERGAS